jgi:hypothetical protein
MHFGVSFSLREMSRCILIGYSKHVRCRLVHLQRFPLPHLINTCNLNSININTELKDEKLKIVSTSPGLPFQHISYMRFEDVAPLIITLLFLTIIH